MSQAYREIEIHDFSDGENLVVSPWDLGPKQSLRCLNVMLDEHGSLRTIDGTKIQQTAPAAETGNKLLLPMVWQTPGGTNQQLVIVKSGGTNKLYNRGTVPWTLLGTFTTNQDTPQATAFGGLLILTDGYNVPKKWDGAAFAALGGGLVGAMHITNHQGFVWVWNTAAATTPTDGKSAIRSSDVNLPETWPMANVAFISKDDGTQGQGMGLFTIAAEGISPTAALVAFKDFVTYQITGIFGASGVFGGNIAIQKVKSDMGCVAPRSIQFVSGFGIIRLTHRGFALYDGLDDRLISEEIRPRLFGRDDIAGIDWSNVSFAWGGQSQNPPIYFCLVPVSGSTGLTRAFLYDLVRRAWTTVDFPFSIASAGLVLQANTLPSVLLSDWNTSHVRRWFAGDLDFDGTAISWTWRSRPVFINNPTHWAFWRRAIVNLLTPTGATITVKGIFGNEVVSNIKVQTFVAQVLGGAVWGIAQWGEFAWGGSGGGSVQGQSLTDDQLPIDTFVTAPNATLELSGTGAVRVRALTWHVKPKPLRRRFG